VLLYRVKHFRTIQPLVYILGLAGGALFIVLLIRQGVEQVGLAIARVGWWLLALILYHQLQTLSDSAGWLVLIPKQHRVRLSSSFFLHWLCESINNLLPTPRVGGDIVLVRVAALWGMPLRIATAAIIVDVTIGVVTRVILVVTAAILLVAATGRTDLARPALITVMIGTLAAAGFYAVQRIGIFRWGARLASRLVKAPGGGWLVQGGETLDQAIRVLYARRLGVAGCYLFWALSWIIASGELWIALRALASPSSFTTAVILESAALAIRGAAFLVPGALGVQEGGFILLGNLLGVPSEIALALSLVRRVRELGLGIPGLAAWQLVESRHLWRSRRP
jgi:putative membrane protein